MAGKGQGEHLFSTRFKAVVFAGGGNRCLWQGGLWDALAPVLEEPPRIMAAVSAGACISVLALAGRRDFSMNLVKQYTAANPRNAYPGNVLSSRPVLPHLSIYRRLLRHSLTPQSLETLRQGPELRILMAQPPRWLGPVLGSLLGMLCYALEKQIAAPLHPSWAARLGYRPWVERAGDCASPEDLTQLILASSCTPPMMPPMYRLGRTVLDGGLIDNTALAALTPAERPALVLLTRRYPPQLLRGRPGIAYIQPSRPVPVAKWDYTSPELLQESYDLGQSDARALLEGRWDGIS